MTSTGWLAAVSGQLPLAQQPNALQVTHASVILYTATLKTAGGYVLGSGSVTSNTSWNATSFTTAVGQTAVGYVIMNITAATTSGSLLSPWTVSLYTDNAGVPGTVLVSTTVPTEYFNSVGPNPPVPLPVTGLTASTKYWIVTNQVGTVSNNYSWAKNNVGSGAATSSNGTSWTTQAYGLTYEVFDQSAVMPSLFTYDDGGQYWTYTSRDTENRIATLLEYVGGQTAAGYQQTFRQFFYTNGLITRLI